MDTMLFVVEGREEGGRGERREEWRGRKEGGRKGREEGGGNRDKGFG